MKKLLTATLVALVMLCFSGMAVADSIAETWTCEVKEGKKVEDVQAQNSKWLKWINAHVDGGGITSAVGTTVVGNSEIFIFVDTYPNLATWAAAKDALDSEFRNAAKIVFGKLRTPSNDSRFSICTLGCGWYVWRTSRIT